MIRGTVQYVRVLAVVKGNLWWLLSGNQGLKEEIDNRQQTQTRI